ncbi:VOC family protein [Rhizorhabdus argentea]|uniref:VOC family protein n=1 Tax=Rhizorhabdus argentea TaxID=1387174 RepID=UPI0030EC79A1
MVNVSQIHYIVLGAKDLDAWEKFATQGIGLGVSERTDKVLHLRCDRWLSRLQIERSDDEDLLAIGWGGLTRESELDVLAEQLKAAGRPFDDVRGDDARARKAIRLIRVRDDDDIVHEIAWGLAVDDKTPFVSTVAVDGFRSNELGLGHVVLSVKDLAASQRFLIDVLGHKVTSHLFIGPHEAVFLRCNPRHHSVALSVSHRPKKLQHLQIEYNSMDDLGRALDRAQDLPLEFVATLGKHVSDWVTSFYVRAPSNITVELAWGARLLADDEPTEYETFTGSVWGHREGMENA